MILWVKTNLQIIQKKGNNACHLHCWFYLLFAENNMGPGAEVYGKNNDKNMKDLVRQALTITARHLFKC